MVWKREEGLVEVVNIFVLRVATQKISLYIETIPYLMLICFSVDWMRLETLVAFWTKIKCNIG